MSLEIVHKHIIKLSVENCQTDEMDWFKGIYDLDDEYDMMYLKGLFDWGFEGMKKGEKIVIECQDDLEENDVT